MASYEERAQAEIDRLVGILERPADDDDLLKVCNFNVRRGHAAAEVIDDIGYVFEQTNADLMGLQEAWPYIDQIVAGCSADWNVVHPAGADGEETTRISAVPILVRKDRFAMVSTRAIKGSEPCAGEDDVPSRWVVEVVADHLASGQRVKYLNTHMNSFVQPYGSNTSICRVREYQQHMNRILEVVESTAEDMPLFISADWNVTFTNKHPIDFYPMRAFGRYGMVSNWSYDRDNNPPTTLKDGGSLFDQIFHRRIASVSFKGDMLVKNHHSDHFGVMAAYGLLHV